MYTGEAWQRHTKCVINEDACNAEREGPQETHTHARGTTSLSALKCMIRGSFRDSYLHGQKKENKY